MRENRFRRYPCPQDLHDHCIARSNIDWQAWANIEMSAGDCAWIAIMDLLIIADYRTSNELNSEDVDKLI